jgi:hypothetical protein
MEGGEKTRKIMVWRFHLRAPGPKVPRGKEVCDRDGGDAHGPVFVRAFRPGDAVLYP